MVKGLQEFIAEIEKESPEQVLRIKDHLVPTNHELSCYMQELEDRGNDKITIFEDVTTVQGEPSPFPVAFNIFATRGRCSKAIGEPEENDGMELGVRFGELQSENGVVEEIATADAPIMQNIISGADVDLTTLPAARYHEKDAGDYFVMACLAKSRDGKFYDVTPTKNLIHDNTHMSISAHGVHHLRRMIEEYGEHGEKCPIVVVLGAHPAFYLGSCALTPWGSNDYDLIAGYLGGIMRVTPSATLGEDFMVPADAEIIIEGYVEAGALEYQNPFGEISGHYQPKMKSPQVTATAICYRDNAIMEMVYPGHAEHINLGAIPKEGSVYHAVKKVVPDVKAVALPHFAKGRFGAFVSVKKRDFRDVTLAGLITMAEVQNMKMVVIVDDDVDVFNETEVMWAVATQCRWEKDLIIVPKVQSFRDWLGDAVAIFDATHPLDVEKYPERNRLPQAVCNEIKKKYF